MHRDLHVSAELQRLEGGRRTRGEHRADALPLVTIVTPVRNGAACIERAIESVVGQSYPAIEYVIIDAGSTDGTREILRLYDKHIDYWISEADGGISDGFNKGIREASGEIIGLLAADDWYDTKAVERVMAAYAETAADIMHGAMHHWEGARLTSTVAADDTRLLRDMTLNHPTMFATRQCYEEVGPYASDFRYAMDYEWVLRAKLLNRRFVYIPEVLANMSRTGASVQHWGAALVEVARAKAKHLPGGPRHYLYCGCQLTKGSARLVLQKAGLHGIIAGFHSRHALVKKIDEPR